MMAVLLSLVVALATLVSGLLPLAPRARAVEMRYLVGFASGAMVSIAIFDMVPEMGMRTPLPMALGFFGTYLIEKLVLIHACGEAECESHALGWVALIGIAAESLIDGAAIAAGYAVSPGLGLGIAGAIFVHELPRGFTTTVIMRQAKYGLGATLAALLVDALFTPVGAILAGLAPTVAFRDLIGFAAGTFLYVGASDLLPEAHRRFNLRVIASVLVGATLIPALAGLLGN